VQLAQRAVEEGEPAVAVAGGHPRVQAVQQRLQEGVLVVQLLAAALQLSERDHPIGDVVQERVEDQLVLLLAELHGHLGLELPAGAVDRGQLQPLPGQLRPAGRPHPGQTRLVDRVIALGDDQIGHRTSARLGCRVAEQPLRGGVPGDHPAVVGDRDVRVLRAVQYRLHPGGGQLLLAVRQPQRDLRLGRGGEVGERRQLVLGPAAGTGVEHAERAEGVPVRGAQREAGVRDRVVLGDGRIAAQPLVRPRVLDDQRPPLLDHVPAERVGQRRLPGLVQLAVEAAGAGEPLPLGVDQGNQRDRGADEPGGQPGQPVQRRGTTRLEQAGGP
jgi:hypothetical protein